MKTNKRRRNVIFSLVFLVLGFMISFSYQNTKKDDGQEISESQFERDLDLRNELIEQEEKNNELYKELKGTQRKLVQLEKDLSNEAETYYNLAEDAEKYRIYLGKVAVKGEGIQITLEDGEYNPKEDNVSNYLVHEHHVFKVINELYISGAQAISINGQRLSHNSYILCNGPVIEVDGYQHPAPFVITAIGDSDVLEGAININGGVKDLLVNDNVRFTLEKKRTIQMDPLKVN
ncbi:DUF881 domain-containing protein [Cytobacillus oceanisediminis]|uniref:DUF881 domain-containing protein n=1 Tax=Niallia alba TaxID=2729105 RepID=A0A7Y0K7V4_9BACI|nr:MULTISPECIES: DUF881 domain-containing protein [Bacillaceae]MBQ6445987.1 DUF881 domain-containing protein [Bacillus sp. (in: firmicutes)]MBZ9535472.1 DUF881 domain-containing protein [Cytobacillus oceanisediminis]NMO77242.1 DUF881 domain-containing protein [Niallia alba]UTI40456.1 DUF881 domain-containing protein [Niallia sp. RD1]